MVKVIATDDFMKIKGEITLLVFIVMPGVYGFVNFGHGFWWYRGRFCKKAGKKLFSKEIINKKEKTWGWVKNTK